MSYLRRSPGPSLRGRSRREVPSPCAAGSGTCVHVPRPGRAYGDAASMIGRPGPPGRPPPRVARGGHLRASRGPADGLERHSCPAKRIETAPGGPARRLGRDPRERNARPGGGRLDILVGLTLIRIKCCRFATRSFDMRIAPLRRVGASGRTSVSWDSVDKTRQVLI